MNNSRTVDGFELEKNEPHNAKKESNRITLIDKLRNMEFISTMLRVSGACAVAASLSLFLLEGWADGNDLQRYLKLLAQTGLLSLAGLILSKIVKEKKGAQLFFGLSLVSVVANFTILGALVYSLIQLDGGLLQYPEIVTWQAIDPSFLWPVLIGAISLLGILSYLSFKFFTHQQTKLIGAAFFTLNLLLLVPVRDPLSISALALIAFVAAIWTLKMLRSKTDMLRSTQTKCALATLFLPSAMIIVRTISLYNLNTVFLLTVAGMGYVIFRTWARYHHQVRFAQYITGLYIAALITNLMPSTVQDVYGLIFALVAAVITLDVIKKRAKESPLIQTLNTLFCNATVLLVVAGNLFIALSSANISLNLVSLLSSGLAYGVSKLSASNISNPRSSRILAMIGMITSAVLLINELFVWIELSNWMLVGLLGIVLIFGGSIYERLGLTRLNKEGSA